MSTKEGVEMTSYSPAATSRAQKPAKGDTVTFWDLYERAAKNMYGENIRVIKTPWAKQQVDNLSFTITVANAEQTPKETSRTIIDINMKEYTNRGQKEIDETMVKVSKSTSKTKGSRYSFSTTKGVDWGIGGNLGAQIMGLSMVGGNASISANYGRHKSKTTSQEESEDNCFTISYEQEEKISVPPGTRVKATITSYSVKYEQRYTIKLSILGSLNLPVTYRTRCQQMCFGICRNSGFVNIKQMLQTLPNYCVEEDMATFTQDGILSWIGQGSAIDKSEEPLQL